MRRLSDSEFKATMGTPMTARPPDAAPPFDFWPYFDAIPSSDFAGSDCSSATVDSARTDPSGRWEHVLVRSATPNVFMVIVLDLDGGEVYGHHLLDLNRHYGLDRRLSTHRIWCVIHLTSVSGVGTPQIRCSAAAHRRSLTTRLREPLIYLARPVARGDVVLHSRRCDWTSTLIVDVRRR